MERFSNLPKKVIDIIIEITALMINEISPKNLFLVFINLDGDLIEFKNQLK
ncbi:hypothetical protein AKFMO35_12100 [Apilactobacillus kunkeei]